MEQRNIQIVDISESIDFPSSNVFIQKFNNYFCSWGQRKTPRDIDGNVKGRTAPLFSNPSKKFFVILTLVSFILSILFIISYVIISYQKGKLEEDNDINNVNYKCIVSAKNEFSLSFIIIGGILIFLNCKLKYI